MENLKYQTVDIAITNGTEKGIISKKITLDNQYNKVKAIQIIVNSNGGDNSFNLGIEDSQGDLHPMTHHRDFEHKGGGYLVGWKPLEIKNAAGKEIFLKTGLSKTLTNDLSFQVIMLLKNER